MDECKNCANADNEYCFACDNGNQYKPMTNAGRIRGMSDEELAEWIEQLESPKCPCDDWFDRCEKWNCNGCWLDWLKEEAKSNDS